MNIFKPIKVRNNILFGKRSKEKLRDYEANQFTHESKMIEKYIKKRNKKLSIKTSIEELAGQEVNKPKTHEDMSIYNTLAPLLKRNLVK